jgi:hypothetical protein
MWRMGAVFATVAIGLSACAPAGTQLTALPSAASAAGVPAGHWAGTLHVEPFAVVFKRGRAATTIVRVWRDGYEGHFAVANGCNDVIVRLIKYTNHHASLWSVADGRASREGCVIGFSGGREGGDLQISITR